MNNTARRFAAVALAVAVVPFAAGSASAAPKHRKAVKAAPAAVATTAASTASTAPAAAPSVTSVIAIGGYVFYNVSYAEAVDLWFAAVAANPGYTPPPVTSVSVDTTVSGTVEG